MKRRRVENRSICHSEVKYPPSNMDCSIRVRITDQDSGRFYTRLFWSKLYDFAVSSAVDGI
jgi:hypothetical protein